MSKSQKEIFLHYKGVILYDTIGDLITELKEKMFERHIKQSIYKKVLMVMIEALENVLKYHDSYAGDEEIKNKYQPEILICKLVDCFEISVSNPVHISDYESFKKRLDGISKMDKQQIKDKYKEIITDGQFSEKGGAGLGIVEMAKISDGQVEFSFSDISQNFKSYKIAVKIKL